MISLDIKELRTFSKGKKNNISFRLAIEGYDWELELEENSMKSSSYYIAENEKISRADNDFCITYKGYLNKKSDRPVRLTISEDLFEGYVVDDSEMIFIKPLSKVLKNYPHKNHYVIFSSTAIIDNPKVKSCGMEEVNKVSSLNIENTEDPLLSKTTTTCRIIEIATEADYEFYQANSSNITTTNNNIISTLNQVEGIYQSTFNIRFQVVFQSVWSTSNDPYSSTISSYGSNTVVNELANWWQVNRTNVKRDLVYFFSAKSGHDVRGAAKQTGAVCSSISNSYAFTNTNENEVIITTSHEIGHLFNATHPDNNSASCSPNRTIMCTGDDPIGRIAQFSAFSQTEINNWINNNEKCLLEMPSIEISGQRTVCTSAVYTINGLPPSSTITSWSTNSPFLSISNGSVTRLNDYNGVVQISATGTLGNTGCTFTVIKEVVVGIVIEGISFHNGTGIDGFFCSSNGDNSFTVNTLNTELSTLYQVQLLSWPNLTVLRDFYTYDGGTLGGVPAGWYILQVRYLSCGQTGEWFGYEVESLDCTQYGNYTISAFPNPADRELNVTLDNPESGTIEIINNYGKSVVRESFPKGKLNFKISTSNLPNGHYILIVKQGSKVIREHLFIQH